MKKTYPVFPILTFFGVVIHEFSHQFFCQVSGIKVWKVKYFQLKNPAGYVEHSQPRNFIQAFLITIGPLILGSFFAFFLFFYANSIRFSVQEILAIWIGLSISLHCFPSDGDGRVLLLEANRHVLKRFNPFALILYPFVFLIKIMNFLRNYYLDYIYSIFLFVLSYMVIK